MAPREKFDVKSLTYNSYFIFSTYNFWGLTEVTTDTTDRN